MQDRWAVGLVWQDFDSLLDGPKTEIDWISPKAGHFLADPFLLQYKGELCIFCEEYVASRQKGRIVVLQRDPRGVWQSRPVLELPFHLSYPWVSEWQGELVCVPEQHQSGRLSLYRCEEFPDRWVEETVLLDVPAVDATPFQHEGRWWMWLGADAASAKHELHLFHSPALTGPWRAHPANPVHIRPNLARCAGSAQHSQGRLLRPAQNRERTYGGSLLVYEVLELSEKRYLERELVRWEAMPHWPYPDGLHHVSCAGDVVAFDCKVVVEEL